MTTLQDIKRQAVNKDLPPSERLGRILYIVEHAAEAAESNPYSFEDWAGRRVNWTAMVGEIYPGVSGHNNPITKEELAVICARHARESRLVQALLAMGEAGETARVFTLVGQVFGGKS